MRCNAQKSCGLPRKGWVANSGDNPSEVRMRERHAFYPAQRWRKGRMRREERHSRSLFIPLFSFSLFFSHILVGASVIVNSLKSLREDSLLKSLCKDSDLAFVRRFIPHSSQRLSISCSPLCSSLHSSLSWVMSKKLQCRSHRSSRRESYKPTDYNGGTIRG